jgi:hypothetical protein
LSANPYQTDTALLPHSVVPIFEMSMQITDHAVMTDTPPREPEPETTHDEEALDEALEESFPASDPPATGGVD